MQELRSRPALTAVLSIALMSLSPQAFAQDACTEAAQQSNGPSNSLQSSDATQFAAAQALSSQLILQPTLSIAS